MRMPVAELAALLGAMGAQANPTIGRYRLAFTMTPPDVAVA